MIVFLGHHESASPASSPSFYFRHSLSQLLPHGRETVQFQFVVIIDHSVVFTINATT